ncbi:hypothetical protein ASF98_08625 [Arthrobacter sp. Leaf337]|nr:hypothetical protein ASF98_08625 [Arthrobacter sp. Leaf337]
MNMPTVPNSWRAAVVGSAPSSSRTAPPNGIWTAPEKTVTTAIAARTARSGSAVIQAPTPGTAGPEGRAIPLMTCPRS